MFFLKRVQAGDANFPPFLIFPSLSPIPNKGVAGDPTYFQQYRLTHAFGFTCLHLFRWNSNHSLGSRKTLRHASIGRFAKGLQGTSCARFEPVERLKMSGHGDTWGAPMGYRCELNSADDTRILPNKYPKVLRALQGSPAKFTRQPQGPKGGILYLST